MLKTVRYLLLFLGFFSSTASADILKCAIGKGQWNYFQSGNTAEEKKCIGRATPVLTTTGQQLQQKFTKTENNLTAAKDVKPVCSGSGGTVKFNGKIFHLDYSDICTRYRDKQGIAYGSKPAKLHGVNEAYRRSISPYVEKVAKKYKLDPAFIHAVISAESAYNPNAKSHAGAEGLMQLMPFTAKRFGVTNSYDPYQNIDAGAKYLSLLLAEFGSLELAAAGYNAGEGAVRRYHKKIPPFKETKAYVPKVMAFYRKYKQNRHLIASN